MKRLRCALRGDEGIAMVTAVLATVIVASLATAGFALSSHDLTSSGQDRRRVQAVHAAEAGIDTFLNYLANTAPIASAQCPGGTGAPAATGTLPTTPPATYTVSVTYFTSLSGGDSMSCPANTPGAVSIRSTGNSAGTTRTMEGLFGLASLTGGYTLYSGAVFSNGNANFNSQATMLPPAGNPFGGDLYSNGNINLNAGGTIYGSVLAQGSLLISGGAVIKQDAMSVLQLTTSGGPTIYGNTRSGTQGISTSNNTIIYGNANYCTGSAPTGVRGVVTGSDCSSGLPTSQPWTGGAATPARQFTYTAADWTAKNYNIQAFSDIPLGQTACQQAQTFISSIQSGDWVVRINSTCTLAYGGQTTVNVNGNLAIVTNGSITMDSHALFTSSAPHDMFWFANVQTPVPCNSTGISFNSQASISTTLSTLLYTPCAVTFGAQSASLNGQVVAGSVSFNAGANITTVYMKIPGSSPNGFAETMAYRREVIS